jgi:hypothetical protein
MFVEDGDEPTHANRKSEAYILCAMEGITIVQNMTQKKIKLGNRAIIKHNITNDL